MAGVEGRDSAYAFDFVDMAAGLDEALAEKRDAWAVAE
jgi:hypothetical protein